MIRIDMTGKRWGRLTAIRFVGRGKAGSMWEFKCDCGNTTVAYGYDVRIGHTSSCGCYWRERIVEAATIHGETDSRTYNSWRSMHDRCHCKGLDNYHRYGGRGIVVCDEWDDYENFKWEMGERPEGMTLDRIDPDGPYAGWNCRWATAKEQRANQRPHRRSVKLGRATV